MCYPGIDRTMIAKSGLLALVLLLALPAAAQVPARARADHGQAAKPGSLDKRKLSYAIGYRIGMQFADGHPDVDMESLIRALRDAYAGRPPSVSPPQMRQQLDALDRQIHNQAVAAFRKQAAENARKSASFMLENAEKPGVVLLPSGVEYKVLRQGSGGQRPDRNSTVVINYRGALINGMEFDSSYAYGHPVTYPVSQMLPGWQDVLPRMQVGDTWKVFIPPDQAYGSRGQLPRIGPNEALVFEIELLGVK